MYKKLLCTLLMGVTLATAFSMAQATAISSVEEPIVSSDSEYTISPYADKIITKYRTHNGKKQYRRWNETKHCWVDPHWIDR